jgi:3',5'-cyclic-AMP phosphodiesterase
MKIVMLLLLVACTRPAEDRALAELAVGHAQISHASVDIKDGLAAIKELADGKLTLWSGAPVFDLTLTVDSPAEWTIVIENSLPDAELLVGGLPATRDPGDRPIVGTWRVPLVNGPYEMHLGPPDAGTIGPYRIVAMADIQTALPIVHQVFEKINEVENARYVVAMGDITERSEIDEYDLFDRQLLTLNIPFYTTLGNHELWGGHERFFDRYGRASFHFDFKGTAFTFADSGDAGLDPLVEQWVDGWLEQAIDQTHIFLTHVPPVDPVGVRAGGFRSSRDGYRLIERLARGNVDLALYGHIHTLVEYQDADIPTFISGGGGAMPMKGDGIDRHFLVIDIDGPVQATSVVRVDD